jgi:hypothetical protein
MFWHASHGRWCDTMNIEYPEEFVRRWELISPPSWATEPVPLATDVNDLPPVPDIEVHEEDAPVHIATEIEAGSSSPADVIRRVFNAFDEPPVGLTMAEIQSAWEWVKYAKHVMETQNDLSHIRTEALKIELAKREPPVEPTAEAPFCTFCDEKGHDREHCPVLAAVPRTMAPLVATIPNCQHIRVIGRSGQATCKICGADLSKTPQPNRFGF